MWSCSRCRQQFRIQLPSADDVRGSRSIDEVYQLSDRSSNPSRWRNSANARTNRSAPTRGIQNSVVESVLGGATDATTKSGAASSAPGISGAMHMFLTTKMMEYVNHHIRNYNNSVHTVDPSRNLEDSGDEGPCRSAEDSLAMICPVEPLCVDCSMFAQTIFKNELKRLETVQSSANQSLQKLDNMLSVCSVKKDGENFSQMLIDEEILLRKEMDSLDREIQELDACESKLDEDESQLLAEEERYWTQFHDLVSEMNRFEEDRSVLLDKIGAQENLLSQLNQVSVISDCFHIWFSGFYGTINNLRIGSLPVEPVDVAEINAALGNVVLLMDTLRKIVKADFSPYRLHPACSRSRIVKQISVKKSDTYEICFEDKRMKRNSRFLEGMFAICECLRRLNSKISSVDSSFELVFRVEEDRVGGISLRSTAEDKWVRAMKNLLISLKYIQEWVVRTKSKFP